jgi:SPP1 gp7 family putative phage head morphogenesis protein
MRLHPPKTSKALEREYYKSLLKIVVSIDKIFNKTVMPVVGQKRVQKQIVDSEYSVLTSLDQAFKEFERKVRLAIPVEKIKVLSKTTTNKVVKTNRTIWVKKLDSFGLDIAKKMSFPNEQDYISSRIKTNTKLITNLRDDYVDSLNTILFSSYQKGLPLKQLTKDIKNQFGISQRKAKLIARNETKNTNTQLNHKQAKSLGFEKGVWLGSEDAREREQHNKHNNKEYKIGVGLDDGKGGTEEPGDAINCRCTFYVDVK